MQGCLCDEGPSLSSLAHLNQCCVVSASTLVLHTVGSSSGKASALPWDYPLVRSTGTLSFLFFICLPSPSVLRPPNHVHTHTRTHCACSSHPTGLAGW